MQMNAALINVVKTITDWVSNFLFPSQKKYNQGLQGFLYFFAEALPVYTVRF